jgi:hypothetical protein
MKRGHDKPHIEQLWPGMCRCSLLSDTGVGFDCFVATSPRGAYIGLMKELKKRQKTFLDGIVNKGIAEMRARRQVDPHL